jgi:hypothetical protein
MERFARRVGIDAATCVTAFIAQDKEDLIGASAGVLAGLSRIWERAGVQPGEVWDEMDKRLQLGNLMIELNEGSHRSVRQGKRLWKTTTTKLP